MKVIILVVEIAFSVVACGSRSGTIYPLEGCMDNYNAYCDYNPHIIECEEGKKAEVKIDDNCIVLRCRCSDPNIGTISTE